MMLFKKRPQARKLVFIKSSTMYFIDRPHDLLVIMAKAMLKGNYLWVNEIEIFVGISCEVLIGIKVSHLHYCPCEDVCGSMAQLLKCLTRSLEPLHKSLFCGKVLDEWWHLTCNLQMQLWMWKSHNVKWVQLNRLQIQVITPLSITAMVAFK